MSTESAILASASLALAELPWSNWRAIPITVTCLIPSAFLVAIVLEVCLAAQRRHVRRIESSRQLALTIGVGAGAASFLVCAVLSNLAFIAEPLERDTVYGYLISGMVAVGTTWHVARSQRMRYWLTHSNKRRLLIITSLSVGIGLSALDATAFSAQYDRLHLVLEGIALIAFAISWRGAVDVEGQRKRKVTPNASTIAAIACVLVGPVILCRRDARASSILAAVTHATVHRRVISFARALVDRDKDGFSSILAGGDCDDHNANAYPLSRVGDPCLRFIQNHRPPAVLEDTSAVGQPSPDVIVLATIDAFRCGMGSDIPEPTILRDACPSISRLGSEGQLRAVGHATYPATRPSLRAIHSVGRHRLADLLGGLGYFRIMVVGTPVAIADEQLRGHFDVIRRDALPGSDRALDYDLKVSRVALEAIRSAKLKHNRVFAWVHYYGTHAPYRAYLGQRLAAGSDLSRYAAEVRRTDAAVGAFAGALSSDPALSGAVLFITADHGEAFGEHGNHRHGSSLYEPEIRVPMLAWRPGSDHQKGLPRLLPFGGNQVGAYLYAVASSGAFSARDEVPMQLRSGSQDQEGIVVGGKKLIYHRALDYIELYDLKEDPGETDNLAGSHPDEVERILGILYGNRMTE